MEPAEIAAALRQLSRSIDALAEAISPALQRSADEDRYRALLTEWGRRGLTRPQASALFRKHGFAPQAAGGWARGDWLEIHDDGLRYLTARSLHWLAEQEAP